MQHAVFKPRDCRLSSPLSGHLSRVIDGERDEISQVSATVNGPICCDVPQFAPRIAADQNCSGPSGESWRAVHGSNAGHIHNPSVGG